jgi:hypothetical protein
MGFIEISCQPFTCLVVVDLFHHTSYQKRSFIHQVSWLLLQLLYNTVYPTFLCLDTLPTCLQLLQHHHLLHLPPYLL